MKDFRWPKNNRLSYKNESAKLIQTLNPLDFLSAEVSGPSSRDAISQLHFVMLLALALAAKMQESVAVESGFLSVISNGSRFQEELGE